MNIQEWNAEYAIYHKNRTNKLIHWVCIPLIMFSLFGLLSILSFQFMSVFIVLALLYYLKLSKRLALGMLLISLFFVSIIDLISFTDKQSSIILYSTIFIVAWIGQFLGHKIEGKKPAFFKDLQFLLIGPLWLLSFIYNKLNIKI